MLKWHSIICVLSMLTLSNCSTWNEGGTPEGSNKVVRMPSISRGTIRNTPKGQQDSEQTKSEPDKEQAATEPTKTDITPKSRDEGRVPTTEQQEAAAQILTNPAPPAITEPTITPTPPANTSPALLPEEEIIPSPRPNSIELRGLRTPTLPNTLPMEVKG